MIGVGTAMVAVAAGFLPYSPQIVLAATIGSLGPDIDHPKSMLGRRLPFISEPLYRRVGHRTATHSAYGVIGATIVASAIELVMPFVGFAFLIGYVLHIAADLITKEGCALLYPKSKKRYRLWPAVPTGSAGETLTVIPIMMLMAVCCYVLNPHFFHAGYWGSVIRNSFIPT